MKCKVISLVVGFILCAVMSAYASDYAIIVHKDNPVSVLSKSDLKQIYLGKKGSWTNGESIVLYSLQDPDVTETFTSEIMSKSAQQFSLYWKKALFTGTGRPPLEMNSTAEMKRFIAADPRGIGYIPKSEVDGSVKVVKIN